MVYRSFYMHFQTVAIESAPAVPVPERGPKSLPNPRPGGCKSGVRACRRTGHSYGHPGVAVTPQFGPSRDTFGRTRIIGPESATFSVLSSSDSAASSSAPLAPVHQRCNRCLFWPLVNIAYKLSLRTHLHVGPPFCQLLLGRHQ